MARLIIIGNGYDLSQLGDKTSYKRFGEWLCNKNILSIDSPNDLPFSNNLSVYSGNFYKSLIQDFPTERSNSIDEDRNTFFATMLVNMIQDIDGSNWNDFEKDLGKLPWREYIEKANYFYKSTNSIPGSPVSYGTEFITSASEPIRSLFAEWISQIDVNPKSKKEFEHRINAIKNNDTIIIFNYTTTFEQLFDLMPTDQRVCHIHGISTQKGSIIVGHGDSTKYNIDNPLDSVSDYIKDVETLLYKDTKRIISTNENLWNKISKDFSNEKECNEIYIYGWSGKNNDEDYINKIQDIINFGKENCSLILSDYKGDGKEKEELWIKKGFEGKIEYIQ